MSGLIGILLFVFALLASIALHELGHLVPAKKFGVKVSQYMVGFGPTIWSKRRDETQYGIKAIPLGGYIRILGMFPPRATGALSEEEIAELLQKRTWRARMKALVEQARADSLQELEGEESRAFYRLTVPKKITVMLGGPLMNLLIAIVLFTIAQVGIGEPQVSTTVSHVVACVPTKDNPQGIVSVDGSCDNGQFTPAYQAGLQAGDRIIGIGGQSLKNWAELSPAIVNKAGQSVMLDYVRAGEPRNVNVTIVQWDRPIYDAQGKDTGKTKSVGFLGVEPKTELQPVSIGSMPSFIWEQVSMTARALISFPAQLIGVSDSLWTSAPRQPDGPVSIVGISQVSGDIASSSNVTLAEKSLLFLQMFASLNLFLFVFNLVPILPLDGGHVAGAIYEGLRNAVARVRRKPKPAPVDTARMLPVAYFVTAFLIVMSITVMLADIFKPVSF